jgi:lysine biosynthesis protein LysW
MAVAFCPECGQGIQLGAQPHEGQRVACSECGAELEVISVRPLELDWVYDEPVEGEDDGDPEEEWEDDRDSAEEWNGDSSPEEEAQAEWEEL